MSDLVRRLRAWLAVAEDGPERLSNEYDLIREAADALDISVEAVKGHFDKAGVFWRDTTDQHFSGQDE